MRYLVECTYVYEHPEDNSGIQRVVRNVINNLGLLPTQENEFVPVVIQNGELYRINSLLNEDKREFVVNAKNFMVRVLNAYWGRHHNLEATSFFKTGKNRQRILHVLASLLILPVTLAFKALDWLEVNTSYGGNTRQMNAKKGDVLVLLDSSWHSNIFSYVEEAKERGVKIVSVIYDLIPITHPQFCDDNLARIFSEWFDWITDTTDYYISISKTIRDEVRTRIQEKQPDRPDSHFGYFYLGSELDLVDVKDGVRPFLPDTLEAAENMYLAVGTIEPRKNHHYMLDAFDLLWNDGVDVYLFLVGKIGWKCEDLIARIHSHPEYGKRLLMYNDLSDAELNMCYDAANAVVFSSFVEGFGLPVVEAKQRGVPVFVSDIAVFREIGQDRVRYFDLGSPDELAELVRTDAYVDHVPSSWISWADSAGELFDAIEKAR